MSTTIGITALQKGAGDWIPVLEADLTRLAAGVDSLSSGNISTGSITVNKLKASNSPSAGYKITIDPTTGDFYYKNNDVIFSELPGHANFTQSAIARVNADLNELEPIPSASIDFDKIDYAGTIPTSGYKIIAHNTTKPELVSQVPVANLPITGTPATGWVVKAQVSSGTVMNLYYDVTANSLESNRLRYTETDMPVYGDVFLIDYVLPYVDLQMANNTNIGKVHDTDGAFVEITNASFYGKIHDTDGSMVEATSASFFGKIIHTLGSVPQFVLDYCASYPDEVANALRWRNVAAFNTTPPSSSTITMLSDQASVIKAGMSVKAKVSGTYQYGQVLAITSNLLTIRGVALSTGTGALTELYVSERNTLTPLLIFSGTNSLGYFASTSLTNTLITDRMPLKNGFKINLPGKSYLVGLDVTTKNHDTGSGVTTQPTINISKGGNNILTSNFTIPNGTESKTGVIINSNYYQLQYGDFLEMSVTAASGGTPAHNSAGLAVWLVLVREG